MGPGDLVVEFGAGQGALTAPLAASGARVVAVERDAAFVRVLARRFEGRGNVRVVRDDLRRVPLPRRRFAVVANIPFTASTAVLRRLLRPPSSPLARADLLVEWGFARRVTRPAPRDLEVAWWAARYEPLLVRRVPARCFAPRPGVDAAHLAVRRRGLGVRAQRALWPLLVSAYESPEVPVRRLVPRWAAAKAAVDAAAAAGEVSAAGWAELARLLAADRTLAWPPLPRRLDRP